MFPTRDRRMCQSFLETCTNLIEHLLEGDKKVKWPFIGHARNAIQIFVGVASQISLSLVGKVGWPFIGILYHYFIGRVGRSFLHGMREAFVWIVKWPFFWSIRHPFIGGFEWCFRWRVFFHVHMKGTILPSFGILT